MAAHTEVIKMEKLFVYGSLAPGKPNEHILQKIGGFWKAAFVWGTLYEEGWGAQMGFPGIRLEEKTQQIKGYVFHSKHLEQYWEELDAFEGSAYLRKNADVYLLQEEEWIEAFIYTLR